MKRYIANDSNLFEHKFYSSRAELSYQEYFMSCVVEFILDKDLLYNTDLEAYTEINKILNKQLIIKKLELEQNSINLEVGLK
jgi:hypothetical protein